jgi:hypothetical protein
MADEQKVSFTERHFTQRRQVKGKGAKGFFTCIVCRQVPGVFDEFYFAPYFPLRLCVKLTPFKFLKKNNHEKIPDIYFFLPPFRWYRF